VKYAWIRENETEFPVQAMCNALNVVRSAYYKWCSTPQTAHDQRDRELGELVEIEFKRGRGVYGEVRVLKKLQQQGIKTSRRRVGRLMRERGLVCITKKPYKVTTDSKHDKPTAQNKLKRRFNPKKPNRVYAGDITYIRTDEGWLYLAIVIDLFSRQIVGYSMADHIKTSLVNDAMTMAIWQRKPPRGLLWHTDRGSQYASKKHRDLLAQHGIRQSMSRKGNCWDNAVSESFFHTLKTELTYHHRYATREQARASIFEYIAVFYNRIRIHSANNYLSPVEFESQHAKNDSNFSVLKNVA
jgi:putative transposase